MPPWLIQTLAGLAVALVSAGGAYLTAKATANSAQKSAQSTVTGQIESSRLVAEQGAYERATKFYEGVITRQDAELEDLGKDLAAVKQENAALLRRIEGIQNSLTQCRTVCRRLASRLGEPDPNFED